MQAADVRSADDARRIVEERELSHVKVGVFDADGILRGKYMAREKFFSALEKGFGFCDVVLGWDSYDQLYDNVRYTGWHTGYPDAPVRIVPETCRELPMEDGGLFFMGAYVDLMLDTDVNESAAQFVRDKISSIVRDPETAARLSPAQTLGCKRLCAGTDYYETFNRDNVHLVDISAGPIRRFTPTGLKVGDTEYDLDAVVFATGYDAMTGSLDRIDIRGRGGLRLKQKWAEGPKTYLGLGTSGFPNFFVIAGPGSPSVLTNMVAAIEQHVDWIADCLAHMQQRGLTRIEAAPAFEEEWGRHTDELASFTLFSSCNSWYLGANIPGKPRVFMPYLSFPLYVEKCEEVVAAGYEGFELS